MKIAVAFELSAFSLYVTLKVMWSSWPEVFGQKLSSPLHTIKKWKICAELHYNHPRGSKDKIWASLGGKASLVTAKKSPMSITLMSFKTSHCNGIAMLLGKSSLEKTFWTASLGGSCLFPCTGTFCCSGWVPQWLTLRVVKPLSSQLQACWV